MGQKLMHSQQLKFGWKRMDERRLGSPQQAYKTPGLVTGKLLLLAWVFIPVIVSL